MSEKTFTLDPGRFSQFSRSLFYRYLIHNAIVWAIVLFFVSRPDIWVYGVLATFMTLLYFGYLKNRERLKARYDSYSLEFQKSKVVCRQDGVSDIAIQKKDIGKITFHPQSGYRIYDSPNRKILMIPPYIEQTGELEQTLRELCEITAGENEDFGLSREKWIYIALIFVAAFVVLQSQNPTLVFIVSGIIAASIIATIATLWRNPRTPQRIKTASLGLLLLLVALALKIAPVINTMGR